MSKSYETWLVLFMTEDGDIHDTLEFGTYEEAEAYCMEKDWVDDRAGGLILYLDITKKESRVLENERG